MSMFHLLSLIGSGGGGAAPGFDPATMFSGGKAGVFYNTADLTSLFEDRSLTPVTPASVNGVVGTRKDFSGNGNHQLAPSDAARPILRTDGSAHYWLEYDAIDDLLSANASLTAVGGTGAIFLGVGASNAGPSVLVAGSPSGLIYTGVLQSGSGGAPFGGIGAPSYNVDGLSVAATRGALFTAIASASGGATPHLFESRNTDFTPGGGFTNLTIGFYASFGNNIRDYGLVVISETDLGANQAALRTWFGERMGLSL